MTLAEALQRLDEIAQNVDPKYIDLARKVIVKMYGEDQTCIMVPVETPDKGVTVSVERPETKVRFSFGPAGMETYIWVRDGSY